MHVRPGKVQAYRKSDDTQGEMPQFLENLWSDEGGQDMVEYSLLLAFIVVCAAAILTSTRVQISDIWSTINSALSSAVTNASGS
jgi:Flp pilus assembly pilin Flp